MRYFLWCALFFSTLFSNELQRLEKRLDLQKQYDVGLWCLVTYKGKSLHGEILEINKDKVLVRIFDSSLPLSEWPIKDFNIQNIRPMYKHHFKYLKSLISSLKYTQMLKTPCIEAALIKIDRAWFCPNYPYFDAAVATESGAHISSPHVYVWVLELLKDSFAEARSVLNVGVGTGYMLAMFSELCPKAKVIGIEQSDSIALEAENVCKNHLSNEMNKRIKIVPGNGEKGHLEQGPYDIIYVDFMCENIPQNLVDQLAVGGIMILPIGGTVSSYEDRFLKGNLYYAKKTSAGSLQIEKIFPCSFVPSQL